MIKRTILLLWLVTTLTVTARGSQNEIHILATNDMHATIDLFPQLAALVDSLRAKDPNMLVLSSGDSHTGNPLNDKYEIPGYPVVALMNQIGFNATALGNHEIDTRTLPQLIALSNFSYVSANIFPADSLGIKTVPYKMLDVAGLKVGIIGAVQLRSKNGIPSTHPDNLSGIKFQAATDVIGQYEWVSKQCDVTIMLSHLGYEEDLKLTQMFPWFDLIIGGHSHIQLPPDEIRNNTLIVQSKQKLGSVAYITLTLDSGKVVGKHVEYIDMKGYPKKSKLVDAMVRHFSGDSKFQRVVAIAETPFETTEELGVMICDALKAELYADIALQNPGGVRIDSHPAGDFTMLDVLEMDPFDDNVVVLDLTGDELMELMLSYSHGDLERIPYTRGIVCELTLDPADDTKVKTVRLLTPDGQKLNMKKKYRVATNSYIPAMGNIPEGSARTLNIQTNDLIIRHLEKRHTLNYKGERCQILK